MSEADFIKSARRVLEIFELFAQLRGPATVSMVQKHFGYPQSSTSKLLKSLVALGYLSYDDRARTYRPTPRVNFLGSWIKDEQLAGIDLPELMQTLHQLTGDSVVLGTQNGVKVQYISILHSTSSIRLHIQPGILRPLCRTALGKMLLTLKSDDEIGLLVRRSNVEAPAHEHVNLNALMDDLALYRRQGYCINAGVATPEIGQVAMLLPQVPGAQPLAIGVGGLLREVSTRWDEIIDAMNKTLATAVLQAEQRAGVQRQSNGKEAECH